MKSQDILPVILSILVIVAVAAIEKQSKLIAAFTATMPLTTTLAFWIVYSSARGDSTTTSQFALSLLLGIVPTIAFIVVLWVASRAGAKLLPTILLGYTVWGVGLAILWRFKAFFHLQ